MEVFPPPSPSLFERFAFFCFFLDLLLGRAAAGAGAAAGALRKAGARSHEKPTVSALGAKNDPPDLLMADDCFVEEERPAAAPRASRLAPPPQSSLQSTSPKEGARRSTSATRTSDVRAWLTLTLPPLMRRE